MKGIPPTTEGATWDLASTTAGCKIKKKSKDVVSSLHRSASKPNLYKIQRFSDSMIHSLLTHLHMYPST
jgi:hypothetical protein